MKRQWVVACAAALAAGVLVYAEEEKKVGEANPGETAGDAKPQAAPAADEGGQFGSVKAKVSYGIGLNIGSSLAQQGLSGEDLDTAIIAEGLKDALSQSKLRVPEAQLRAALEQFDIELQAKKAERQAAWKAKGEAAKKEGETFLAANAKKEGVKVTDSGLQYEVIKQGDGPRPKSTDTVTVHYKGTLVNGEEFDSSYKREEPATFSLDNVIPGWTEGLQLMPVGSKYKLYIPQELGYGARGSAPKIPPNSALVFEVEMLKVGKQ